MKIIIIGGGEVGFYLAKILSQERHDIALIDRDPERVARARSHLDVLAIEGNGASAEVLMKAGAGDADLLVAVTSVDEVNLIACFFASKLGTRRRIARIGNPELTSEAVPLWPTDLGIDLTIYPEGIAGEEISRVIMRSAATDVLEFADGKVQIIGIRLDASSPLINRKLADVVKGHAELDFRTVVIHRAGRTLIPGGDDTFKKNDQVFAVCKSDYVQDMLRLAGKDGESLHNIMILGGGRIGREVAKALQDEFRVKLIESNKERSEGLAESLKKTLVIRGEASDIDLLAAEGIAEMDAYVAVTNDEESNIISCLMAKHLGVKKTIALIENLDYFPLAGTIGLDVAVNKKLSAAQVILKFIRKGEIVSVATLHGVDAEVIEFVAQKGSPITKKPIREVNFPKDAIIACVTHGDAVSIPLGSSRVSPGDRVVVITLPKAIRDVEKLFSR